MVSVELEKTYLAKYLPEGWRDFPHKEIIDIYLPAESKHPVLRLRKRGDICEITKKQPISEKDSSEQTEHTIRLSVQEFDALSKVSGKKLRKIRYYHDYGGAKAEIDVFQDNLEGLVMIDVEFADSNRKSAFIMPEFCLEDITQDEVFAGGMLCGKGYSDVEGHLRELGYERII